MGQIIEFRKVVEEKTLVELKKDDAYKELQRWSVRGEERENRLEALKRIEQCISGASRNLDLSNLGLTSLPNNLFDFYEIKKLETINLSGNRLGSLPPGINSLNNLQERNTTQANGTTLR